MAQYTEDFTVVQTFRSGPARCDKQRIVILLGVIDMADCTHIDRNCINHYELIRKYECSQCGGIMMCACDEVRGREFLPHQLQFGTRLESQEPVQCKLGFVSSVCNECRGLPVEAYPAASILGRTSKIKRYYWRELLFREQELFKEYGGKPANYIL